jgi:hypothetical protein
VVLHLIGHITKLNKGSNIEFKFEGSLQISKPIYIWPNFIEISVIKYTGNNEGLGTISSSKKICKIVKNLLLVQNTK